MPATVLCFEVSLALLPGATGRADAFGRRRAEIIESLTGAIHGAIHEGTQPLRSVTVIAPGLATRHIQAGVPDVAAAGLDPSLALGGARVGERVGADYVVPESRLHVTASAAVAFLRLAGWTQDVAVIELATDDPDAAEDLVIVDELRNASEADLVVVALATTDGLLPAGAPLAFVDGERRAHAIRTLLERVTDSASSRPVRH
jgi:hypothetical protein